MAVAARHQPLVLQTPTPRLPYHEDAGCDTVSAPHHLTHPGGAPGRRRSVKWKGRPTSFSRLAAGERCLALFEKRAGAFAEIGRADHRAKMERFEF